MIKVMIADDQELIRQSLQIVLEMKEGIEVTATAKDGREVIQEVRNHPAIAASEIGVSLTLSSPNSSIIP